MIMANSNEDVNEVIKILTEHIGHDWRQLGQQLGLSKSDLDCIEDDNQYLRDRIYDLFYQWKRRNGLHATVKQLKAAVLNSNLGYLLGYLEDVEADNAQTKAKGLSGVTLQDKGKEASNDIIAGPPPKKQKLCELTPNEQTVAVYRNFLMDMYSSKLPVGSKWPEMGSNEYINLTISEKHELEDAKENVTGDLENFTEMNSIEITQVGGDRQYSVYIITGAPGVGKSCYVWWLATKWKEKELFTEYTLAIVIRLREPHVRHAINIMNLIQHEMCDTVSHWMISNNGKGCLLILDGFDEFPAELRRDSLIKQIISGEKLGRASLIITTRSNAAKDLYHICNRRKYQNFEVLGFNKKQIDGYILSTYKTDISQKDFQTYLQYYPNIRSFMCNPLHCAIVVQIYRSQRAKKEVPKTMTELYTDAVKVMIVRSLQSDNPSFTEGGLDSFIDLPQGDQNCLMELSRIAYESTLKDELVFHSKMSEQMKRLDLVEAELDLYNLASTSISYHFVHKTIQEFLAAYYISLLSSDLQSRFFREQFYISRMTTVLKFVAGLTKFNPLTNYLKDLFITVDAQTLMQCVHCLFETQNSDFIKTVLESRKIFDLTLYTLSPYDYYALNYCIAMSKVEIDLRLDSRNISDEALTLLQQPTSMATSTLGYVKEFVFNKNPVVKSGVSDIIPSPPIGLKADMIRTTSMKISWQPPHDVNSIIGNYQVSYTPHGESEYLLDVSGDTTSTELTSLKPCTKYTICVRAKTVDFGGHSIPITVNTLEVGD